jgi:hypothetical protein
MNHKMSMNYRMYWKSTLYANNLKVIFHQETQRNLHSFGLFYVSKPSILELFNYEKIFENIT